MAMDKAWQDFLREQFVLGSHVKVRQVADPDGPASGTTGKLMEIDENGGFHVQLNRGGIVVS